MTNEAQSALRRTMETYSKVTRFCIICNYISRLIPPIASRCAKFRFKPLPAEAMVSRLMHIATVEAVDITVDALGELMRCVRASEHRRQLAPPLHSVSWTHVGLALFCAAGEVDGCIVVRFSVACPCRAASPKATCAALSKCCSVCTSCTAGAVRVADRPFTDIVLRNACRHQILCLSS